MFWPYLWFLPRAFFTHGGRGCRQTPGLPCTLSLRVLVR